jgi:hypothetical protein
MVQEQTTNINMAESINEFDIFMSDTPLDLSLLLQPKASGQLPIDQTFISFSQSTLDPLEDISFEVGRDAPPSVTYSPAKDSTLDHSLMKDAFLSMEVPRNEQDALGDQGALDFGFENDLNPPQDDFDMYHGDEGAQMQNSVIELPMVASAAENELGGFEFANMDASALEVPSVLQDLTFNAQGEEDELKTPTKKRMTQQKKRKVLVDSRIELTSEFLKSQLKDTSDIEIQVQSFDVAAFSFRFKSNGPLEPY